MFVCTLFPAPAAAPHNLTSTTINATAIQVQWEPVPEIDRNGQIISYEVRVDHAGFQNVSYVNVSGSELVLVVDGLEEFVEYNFTIRAYTIAGPGPFSVITTSTTNQAGKRKSFKVEKVHPQMMTFTCSVTIIQLKLLKSMIVLLSKGGGRFKTVTFT